jgi:4-aminobutyrate aminotransferase-like enzyme
MVSRGGVDPTLGGFGNSEELERLRAKVNALGVLLEDTFGAVQLTAARAKLEGQKREALAERVEALDGVLRAVLKEVQAMEEVIGDVALRLLELRDGAL